MATTEIIKLYERYGDSQSSKPYIIEYYAPRVKLSASEFNQIKNYLYLVSDNAEQPSLSVFKSIVDIGKISNRPTYVWRFSGTFSYDELIDSAASYGFLNSKEYDINAASTLYLDISANADFTQLLAQNVTITSNRTQGNESGLRYYCSMRSASNTWYRKMISPIIYIVDGDTKVYYSYLDISTNNGVSTPLNTSTYIEANSATELPTEKAAIISNIEPYVPKTDPYDEGGNSDSSNSAGTFANTGSDVGLPGLPSVDPSATGFMKAYNPSGADLNNFASYLWNTLDIGALKSLYSNPMEAVIGLLMIPASPTVGAAQTVNLGNIATTVSMPIITNRFKEIDCGTVTIPEWWGAYLDYSPYTEVSIYLPYVGVQQLDTNEVMGKPVHVVYHIDVLTGALVALLECDGKCIYHFAGNCGVQIPITASSFGGVLQTALSVGMSAIQSIASQAAGNFQSVSEVATSVFSGAKTRVQKSGSLGSAAGFADNQTPFFIIQRPVQCKPEDQNKFSGYPSYITDTLSDLTGYTEIELIQLSNISATDTEREEIDSLLRAGVIL